MAGASVLKGHFLAITGGRDPSVLAHAHHSHPPRPPRRRRILAIRFRDRAVVVFVAVDSRANPKESCTPPPRRRRVCFGKTVEAASAGCPMLISSSRRKRGLSTTARSGMSRALGDIYRVAWRGTRDVGVADVPLPRPQGIHPQRVRYRSSPSTVTLMIGPSPHHGAPRALPSNRRGTCARGARASTLSV